VKCRDASRERLPKDLQHSLGNSEVVAKLANSASVIEVSRVYSALARGNRRVDDGLEGWVKAFEERNSGCPYELNTCQMMAS